MKVETGKLLVLSPAKLSYEELSFFREYGITNFIFFKRHISESFPDLLSTLRQSTPRPALLGVDQEGGKVTRISGDFMSPLAAGRLLLKGEEGAFLSWAYSLAEAVRVAGLNLNLAPCVDLADETSPAFLQERTFGKEPELVIRCAENFIRAHQKKGILTCLKHFPGLAGVDGDPHQELPVKESISKADLSPFRRLSSLTSLVMTTHVVVASLDRKPVTFSAKAIGLLRDFCQFKGPIITDDLNMGALSGYELVERLIASLASGHNLLLFCGDPLEVCSVMDDFIKEVEKSRTLREREKESYTVLEHSAHTRYLFTK